MMPLILIFDGDGNDLIGPEYHGPICQSMALSVNDLDRDKLELETNNN